MNASLMKKVGWANDPKIKTTQMDFDRSGLKKEEEYKRIKAAMQDLMDREKNLVDVSALAATNS